MRFGTERAMMKALLFLVILWAVASTKAAKLQKKKHGTGHESKTQELEILQKLLGSMKTMEKPKHRSKDDSSYSPSSYSSAFSSSYQAPHRPGDEYSGHLDDLPPLQEVPDTRRVEIHLKKKLGLDRVDNINKLDEKHSKKSEIRTVKKHHSLKELLNDLEYLKREDKPDSCTPRYEALPDSTMCAYHDSDKAADVGVSDADKQTIVDEHNRYRAEVNPYAANMQKMKWDDEIAVIAQKWAQVCKGGHDKNNQRYVPGYGVGIGQNYGAGHGSWASVIGNWHSEVKDFTYGSTNNVFDDVGHYTQVVRDQSSRIGCGYAVCDGTKTYICNYAYGNLDWIRPYKEGTKYCEDCTNSCSANLCDCNGLLCKNGGTLDIDSCKCSCTNLWGGDDCSIELCPGTTCQNGGTLDTSSCKCNCVSTLYIGDYCENKDCPALDPTYCNKDQPEGYPQSFCKDYPNQVPYECPIMCNECPAVCSEDQRCLNGGTLDSKTCKCQCTADFEGSTCKKYKVCPYNGGKDQSYCGTQWPKDYCTIYGTSVESQCPKMCEVC